MCPGSSAFSGSDPLGGGAEFRILHPPLLLRLNMAAAFGNFFFFFRMGARNESVPTEKGQ